MQAGRPTGKIKINMIAELPCIKPMVLRTSDQVVQVGDSKEKDESRFYPTPRLYLENFRYVPIENADEAAYFHFPALVYEVNNEPWPLGNLYLTSLAFRYPPISRPSLKKVALSLVDHINTMIESDIDILCFPTRKSLRPTYAYSFHLREKLAWNPDSVDVYNQHIAKIEGFYRYLVREHGLKPDFPMWKEERKNRRFIDRHGLAQSKDYTTTDLRLKATGSRTSHTKIPRLRAYTSEEQIALIDSLLHLGNTEMSLAFLTALLAGARMQSVFTMPRSILNEPLGTSYLQTKIGLGTHIDTKYDSANNIYLPLFLVEMLTVYVNSERYSARERLSYLANHNDNYIFLTKSGRPYYSQKRDPSRGQYKNPQEGGAIYAFIRNQLEPLLIKNGHDFKVSFHNLRATFANNTVNELLKRFEKNEISMTQVITIVSERLGHQSIQTTELYIEDIKRQKIQALAQDKWEQFLESRIRRSFGVLNGNGTASDHANPPR